MIGDMVGVLFFNPWLQKSDDPFMMTIYEIEKLDLVNALLQYDSSMEIHVELSCSVWCHCDAR